MNFNDKLWSRLADLYSQYDTVANPFVPSTSIFIMDAHLLTFCAWSSSPCVLVIECAWLKNNSNERPYMRCIQATRCALALAHALTTLGSWDPEALAIVLFFRFDKFCCGLRDSFDISQSKGYFTLSIHLSFFACDSCCSVLFLSLIAHPPTGCVRF